MKKELKTLCGVIENKWEMVSRKEVSASLVPLINLASRNRVLFYFCQQLLQHKNLPISEEQQIYLKKIHDQGSVWQGRLKRTVSFILDTFSRHGIPFLIVKTDRLIPYVTYDVDLLVRPEDFEKTKEMLASLGELGRHPGKQSQKQVNFFGDELLTIDIHKGFYWQGFSYVDEQLAWKNQRSARLEDIEYPAPCLEIELILEFAHLIYERRYITILDLYFLDSLLKQGLDVNLIGQQVVQFSWRYSFLAMFDILHALANEVFPGEPWNAFSRQIGKTFGLKRRKKTIGRIDLPFLLSPIIVSRFFWEKISASKKMRLWDMAYYCYATTRYFLSGRKRFPYYIEWFER